MYNEQYIASWEFYLKDNKKFYELAAVIPAYNESECISEVISSWSKCFSDLNISYKIIVVNDGSTDETGKILDELENSNSSLTIIHQENMGHGKSLFHGYQRALQDNAEFVFQTDSDDQFTPKDFPLFWVDRFKSPFILGHRHKRKDPLIRKFISKTLSHLIFRYFSVEVEDANCPFRLMESGYLKSLLTIVPKDVFAPNLFLSILAATEKSCLKEIVVEHCERHTGTNSILRLSLLKACWKSFKDFYSFKVTLYDKLKILKNIRETDQKLNAA